MEHGGSAVKRRKLISQWHFPAIKMTLGTCTQREHSSPRTFWATNGILECSTLSGLWENKLLSWQNVSLTSTSYDTSIWESLSVTTAALSVGSRSLCANVHSLEQQRGETKWNLSVKGVGGNASTLLIENVCIHPADDSCPSCLTAEDKSEEKVQRRLLLTLEDSEDTHGKASQNAGSWQAATAACLSPPAPPFPTIPFGLSLQPQSLAHPPQPRPLTGYYLAPALTDRPVMTVASD